MTIVLSSQETIRTQEAETSDHSVRELTRVEYLFHDFVEQVHLTRAGVTLITILAAAFVIVTAMTLDAIHASQAADAVLQQTTLGFDGENVIGTGSAVIGSNR